jgi:hypothetical protein
MQSTGADFTNSFRALSLIHLPNTKDFDQSIGLFLSTILDQCCDAEEWKFVNKSSIDERYFSINTKKKKVYSLLPIEHMNY